MAMAMKCDVCGKFFDNKNDAGYIEYYILSLACVGLRADGDHRCSYHRDEYDLCPVCVEKIRELLDTETIKQEEPNDDKT